MNHTLEEILRTRRVRSANGDERDLDSEISVEEGLLLQKAIQESNAVKTLEIGLCYGVSTLFICEAIANRPGAHHIVMDPAQSASYGGIGLDNIQAAGYSDLLEFYEQSSHVVLPQLEAKGVRLDFAFVDGSHLFDYTLLEFFYIDKLLRVGGIIAFDDAFMPGVQKVCRFISTNRCYEVFDCVPSEPTWKQNLKYGLVKSACSALPGLARLIRPELQDPDIEHGLIPGSRYVAFKKTADDTEQTRPWHFYRDF